MGLWARGGWVCKCRGGHEGGVCVNGVMKTWEVGVQMGGDHRGWVCKWRAGNRGGGCANVRGVVSTGGDSCANGVS